MYLTQGLHRALQQHPDRIATLFPGRQRTYREFGDRVACLAGALLGLGLGRGDRVAMLALNTDRYLEYQMAVVWAGGVLNPINIRWSPPEIVHALNDSASTILLVDEVFCSSVDALRSGAYALREVIYCGDGEAPEGMHGYESLIAAATPVPDAERSGNDLAGIFYTGGTTGSPKGVMLSHANLCVEGLSLLACGFIRPGIYLHAAPMFHIADYSNSVAHSMVGNTHSIIPMFTPEAVLRAIERDRVTSLVLVPTMLQMLVDDPAMHQPRDLSSVRTIGYGASPISEATLIRVLAAFPGVEFVQAYGMTEVSASATLLGPDCHTVEGRKRGKLRSAGRALPSVEVKIVDPDDQEVPRGTVGEVVVRGPTVMLGYWNRPEETQATLRGGWMHTGDGAYMDDEGYIFIVDRLKDMIVSGGENVYCAEVEGAVSQHPAVAACAVIGIPSDRWGEVAHAVVVLKPGHTVVAEDLIAHCRTMIAGFKCPRSVAFVDALPLSGAGKVLKTKLREPFWQGRQRGVS